MTENNPIELKSDDGYAKIIMGMGGVPEQEQDGGESSNEQNNQGGEGGASSTEKTPEQIAAEQSAADANKGSQASESQIDINKVIEEKTGGKFKSIEELNSIIEEKEKSKVEIPTFENDIDKLYWAASQKGDVSKIKEIADLERKNVDKISEKELLLTKLKSEMQGLSDDEIEDEYYERYGLGFKPLTEEEKNELTEREIAAHEKAIKEFERKRKADTFSVKESLKKEIDNKKSALLEEYKSAFEVKEQKEVVKEPEKKETKEPQNQERELTEEEIKDIRNRFDAEVKQILPKVSKVSLKDKVEISDGVEDDLEINYELTESDHAKVLEYLADYELTPKEEKEFISVVNGKEQLDLEGLIKSKLPSLFGDKLQKIRDKEVAARAREYVIKKDLKRVDLTPESGTTRNVEISDAERNFMEQWGKQVKNQ